VNRELRLAAVFAALIPPLGNAAASTAAPEIRVPTVARIVEHAPAPLTVAIPSYVLTTKERETVATCLVLEAANQGEFGMRSVMAVIRNRARGRPELFAPTVLRERQFSALNKLTAGYESLNRTIARASADRMWPVALAIVDDATSAAWHDPTEGATHYTRTGERNRWVNRLTPTVKIGAHSFYR
jgi:spore germination cell wall hydrolase CwlJ-like protein